MTTESVIDAYCEAWGERDAAARTARLAAVLGEGARYTDPRTDVRGAEALSAHIGMVLSKRPGSRVVRDSAVDEHHGVVRFNWRAVTAQGSTVLDGIDVADLGPDGRITRIVGFFGPLSGR